MLQPPEPFNFDKPETWKCWIKRFERYRVASKLSEESEKHQINQLIYRLGSKADEVFSTLLLTEAQAAQFNSVKSKFDSYFDATKNVIFERAQFLRRVQQPNENVDDFITCLHSLVDRCDYGAIKDEMVRDRLVVGLKDQALSERLQMDLELTLKKLLIWPITLSELKSINKCCATMIVTYPLRPLDKNHPRNLRDPLEVALNHVTGAVITVHITSKNKMPC